MYIYIYIYTIYIHVYITIYTYILLIGRETSTYQGFPQVEKPEGFPFGQGESAPRKSASARVDIINNTNDNDNDIHTNNHIDTSNTNHGLEELLENQHWLGSSPWARRWPWRVPRRANAWRDASGGYSWRPRCTVLAPMTSRY